MPEASRQTGTVRSAESLSEHRYSNINRSESDGIVEEQNIVMVLFLKCCGACIKLFIVELGC